MAREPSGWNKSSFLQGVSSSEIDHDADDVDGNDDEELAAISDKVDALASPCDWKKRRRKSRSTWLSLESSPSRVSMRTSPGPADSSFTAMEGRKRSLSSESASTFSCLRKLGAYGGAKLIRRRHVAEGCYFTVANKL